MSAIMAGVANTSRVPLPIARAVFDSVTEAVLDPLIPMLNMYRVWTDDDISHAVQ